MDLKLEVNTYENMRDTEDLIESIQGRIYCYSIIPLEKRDELSKKLYEIRMELNDYSNKLGDLLEAKGAFD